MNCRFEYTALFIICVLTLTVIGCATHTVKHDQGVETFYSPWLDKSFEEFLEENPDPKQSTPIGQGNYRHTFVYDIESQAKIVVNLLAALGETATGRDDYYHTYVYVNSAGTIFDILSLLKHGRFWYHQELPAIASLTFSTPKVDAPT